MRKAILVSACLLGLDTRYNGETRDAPDVLAYLQRHDLQPIPVCPEQLAGLPTPRPAVVFRRGDGDALLDGSGELIDAAGRNCNEAFLHGAAQTLKIARLTGCSRALLKERSPSCGCHSVHRESGLVAGRGVTAALLLRHGFTLISEEDIGTAPPPP